MRNISTLIIFLTLSKFFLFLDKFLIGEKFLAEEMRKTFLTVINFLFREKISRNICAFHETICL